MQVCFLVHPLFTFVPWKVVPRKLLPHANASIFDFQAPSNVSQGISVYYLANSMKHLSQSYTQVLMCSLRKHKQSEYFPIQFMRAINILQKRNRWSSPININTKILNQTLQNQVWQSIKRTIQHDQFQFIIGMKDWFNIQGTGKVNCQLDWPAHWEVSSFAVPFPSAWCFCLGAS